VRKIPTIFERDENDRGRVTTRLVVDVEGAKATVKWDGTAVLHNPKDRMWYARHTLRRGKKEPWGWFPVSNPDPVTGKQEGWKLLRYAPEFQYHWEALGRLETEPLGTYELVGPKVQGDPYGLEHHILVPHGRDALLDVSVDFDTLSFYLLLTPIEGIVWWGPEGPVGKIKRRDFGLPWPPEGRPPLSPLGVGVPSA